MLLKGTLMPFVCNFCTEVLLKKNIFTMRIAENCKRPKRGSAFVFAFRILNFSFKNNSMVMYFNVFIYAFGSSI